MADVLLPALLRFGLLAIALVAAGAIIITHGVRGIAALVVLTILVTVPRTRAWRYVSGALIRLAGSGRRAAVLVMVVIIGVAIVVTLLPLVH